LHGRGRLHRTIDYLDQASQGFACIQILPLLKLDNETGWEFQPFGAN
jgi:hypothetical protein